MQETILSDLGWMICIGIGFILLVVTVWGYFSAMGHRKIVKRGEPGYYTTRISDYVGKTPMIVFATIGIIFVVATLAMFSFYYQVAGGQPYISTEMGNLMFVSVVVILIVCMFTLAMALLKNYGALGMWRTILKERGL
jgi:hypothetical protein